MLQATVLVQSLSNFICKLRMIRGETVSFIVIFSHGQKVKVTFGTLHVKPCGHDIGYSFSPMTFKLHMQAVDDERRNSIDSSHGVKGQGQLWHSACETLWARNRQ